MHDMYIAGLCIGGIVLGPIWLYFTTKLVVAAYFNVKRQVQRREKNGEDPTA